MAAGGLHLGPDTALVIGDRPGLRIKSLDLRRGALVVHGTGAGPTAVPAAGGADGTPAAAAAADGGAAAEGGSGDGELVVDGLAVENEGWEWRALDPDAGAPEEEYIRGFTVVRHAQQALP